MPRTKVSNPQRSPGGGYRVQQKHKIASSIQQHSMIVCARVVRHMEISGMEAKDVPVLARSPPASAADHSRQFVSAVQQPPVARQALIATFFESRAQITPAPATESPTTEPAEPPPPLRPPTRERRRRPAAFLGCANTSIPCQPLLPHPLVTTPCACLGVCPACLR